MQKIVDGIQRFQKRISREQRKLFEKLADGQRPEALFITCSDSRINPSLLTQSSPGDLFILRNAGNIVPPYGCGGGEAATIEYAVSNLGVTDVIVCGHSHCGAMAALFDPNLGQGAPAVTSWLRHAEVTQRIVRENYEGLEGAALNAVATQENVLAQLDNLRTHPCIATRVARGAIQLHAWVYLIETAEVFTYDQAQGFFVGTRVGGDEQKVLPGLLNARPI